MNVTCKWTYHTYASAWHQSYSNEPLIFQLHHNLRLLKICYSIAYSVQELCSIWPCTLISTLWHMQLHVEYNWKYCTQFIYTLTVVQWWFFFWKNECILPDYSHPIKKRIGITTRINTTLHKLKKPTSLVHTL